MTHAEFLHRAVAEIAEELPGFDDLEPVTQQNLCELGEHYFHDEFVPRLEGSSTFPATRRRCTRSLTATGHSSRTRSDSSGRPYGPSECSGIIIMPKNDHHKAAAHHDEAAKSHRKAAELHEQGDAEQASQHSQIANDHSKQAQEASNAAHQKSRGPKTL